MQRKTGRRMAFVSSEAIEEGKGTGLESGSVVRRARGSQAQNGASVFDVGWGFQLGWGLASTFTDVFSSDGSASLGAFWISSMLGISLGLLACCFLGERLKLDDGSSPFLIAALASMVLGDVVLAACLWLQPAWSEALQFLAGLLSSLGSAAFVVSWGIHYSRLDMQRIERSATLSLIVEYACFVLVLVLPQALSVVFVTCLPLVAFVFLKVAMRATTYQESRGQEGCDALGRAAALDMGRFVQLGLGIVGTSAAVSLFWSLVGGGSIQLSSDLFAASVLSSTVIAVLLFLYLANFSRALNLGTLYRFVLPLVAIAFALVIAFDSDLALISSMLIFAAQALMELLTFVYFAELAQRNAYSPYKVFGLGRFFLDIGFLIGSLCVQASAGFLESSGSCDGVLAIALAAYIVLVMISISTQGQLMFTFQGQGAAADDVLAAGEQADKGLSAGTSLESAPADEAAAGDADGAAGEGGAEAEGERPVDGFTAACDRIAGEHGLTKREREVLHYLAQGYSLPYIRNELYIAQSTIDTHVRHIYQKLGIHSKEELITMVHQEMGEG